MQPGLGPLPPKPPPIHLLENARQGLGLKVKVILTC